MLINWGGEHKTPYISGGAFRQIVDPGRKTAAPRCRKRYQGAAFYKLWINSGPGSIDPTAAADDSAFSAPLPRRPGIGTGAGAPAVSDGAD